QAEDGIRDFHVTGVQTCALPIFNKGGLVQNHKQIAKGALPATVVEDASVTLKVIVGEMKFDQELIHAKAGTVLKIRLENPDFMRSEERRVGKESRSRWMS